MTKVPNPTNVKDQKAESFSCLHCDEAVIHDYPNAQGEHFCCPGCRTVYSILQDNNLTEYYSLRKSSGAVGLSLKGENLNINYSYLDDKDYIEENSYEEDGSRFIRFYIEGIHCLACLWLLEKIPEFVEGVTSARLDIGKSILRLKLPLDSKLSPIAETIHRLGYTPHLIKNETEQEQLLRKEERKDLLRIGVAAFASMNIMLYSVSVYAGATDLFGLSFTWASLLLTLPVLFFSAIPFYKNSLSALKNRKTNIDQPIAIALILGSIFSAYKLINQSTETYFDTLSILVFLILLSRYFVKKILQQNYQSSSFKDIFVQKDAHIFDEEKGKFITRHSKFISSGDKILVKAGEMFPADGFVLQGESYTNNSLLSGESHPIKCTKGTHVFSATQNISEDIILRVQKTGDETKVGKILKKLEFEKSQTTPFLSSIDKFSGYFLTTVFVLSTMTILAFALLGEAFTGLERALALIIVTCPCALGIATPLALTKSLNLARKLGIFLKHENLYEKVQKASEIFLDKTGTLTHGQLGVESIRVLNKKDEKDIDYFKSIILSLESKSSHPIAKSLVKILEEEGVQELPVQNYKETTGRGVAGDFGAKHFEIRSFSHEEQSILKNERDEILSIALYRDGTPLCSLHLKDFLREESKDSVIRLKQQGLNPWLLSGDNEVSVRSIGKKVEIRDEQCLFGMTPDDKYKIIKNLENTIMVGDGANDSLALQKASVGIAVKGAMEISLQAADIYLLKPGISSILSLVNISKGTMSLVRRNLVFSVIYNLLGASLAMAGYITPLMAAILMPLSSLTVLFSTLIGNRLLNTERRTL